MVLGKAIDFLNSNSITWLNVLVMIGLILFLVLLILTIFYPLVMKKIKNKHYSIHKTIVDLKLNPINSYNVIGLALDFSQSDQQIISHALNQANDSTKFVLIHIVESAGAKVLGEYSADNESLTDEQQLNIYKDFFSHQHKEAIIRLGYRSRTTEIVRICKEENVNMLILGAHGHKGFFDLFFGQTIDTVRHQLEIPILIVK
jgi:manganese transport protein